METLGVHLPSLLIYLVNFLLVLGLLFAFAYKPILRMMDQRADRIRESLEASERAREEAASSQQAVEDQLVEARREGQRIMDLSREAAERFRAEEMERARNDAETVVSRAESDIQRERDAAIEEVRGQLQRPGHHRRRARCAPVTRPPGPRGPDHPGAGRRRKPAKGLADRWHRGYRESGTARPSSSWPRTRALSNNGARTWPWCPRPSRTPSSAQCSSTPEYPRTTKRRATEAVLGATQPMVRNMVNLLVARGLGGCHFRGLPGVHRVAGPHRGTPAGGGDHCRGAGTCRGGTDYAVRGRPHRPRGGGHTQGRRGDPRRPGHPDRRPPDGRQCQGAAEQAARAVEQRHPLGRRREMHRSGV